MKSTPTLRFSTKRLFLLTLVCSVAVAALLGIAASANRANRNVKARADAANLKSGINLGQNSNDKQGPLAPLVPTITATLTDNVAAAAKVAPGDTINYTAVITNSGTDATNVIFSNPLDANTTLVPNSVNTTPIATNDTFAVTGNVRIQVPDGATDLLGNDIDPDTGNNTGLTASSAATSTQGGNVVVNANGSFSYNPAPGFTGADSFTYTVTDGSGATDTGTVTLNVAGMIWFIDDSATPPGDGRLTSPYSCYTGAACFSALAADDPGDNIFLYNGSYTGGYTLMNTQKLIGQGSTTTLDGIAGITLAPNSDALPALTGNPSTVTITTAAAATNGITLASGNTLRGFTVGNTTAVDISGTGFGTLTASEMDLNGTGRPLNLSTGTLAATFATLTATAAPGGAGISLTGVGGSLTVTGAVSITGAGTQGITISGSTLNSTFGSTTVASSGSTGILIGTHTLGTLTFGNTTVTGGSDGVSFQNNASGTRTFGTLNATVGGNAFLHGASGGNVTVTGAATLNSPGSAVAVSGPGATNVIDFQGATSATTTAGGAAGVSWLGTNGAIMTFSALTVQSLGFGINAAIGGTINVTNGTGTVNNTPQAAPAIGASNIALNANFASINALGNGSGGVTLGTVTGTSNFGTGSLSGAFGAPVFNVSGGSANVTYSGNISQSTAGQPLISVTAGHTGTLTFNTGTVNATNGTGLQFSNADGTYNFNGTTTLNGGDAGIDITTGSGGTFSFGTGTTITDPSGIGFNHNGSTAGVTYSGNISKTGLTTGLLVDINTQASGTITFQTGTLSTTNTNSGIQLSNADGTVNFNGTTTMIGGASGVSIITGCAGTFTFSANTSLGSNGIAYNEDTSTANVTYNGTISKSDAANAVNINAKTGGTTLFSRTTGSQITANTSTAGAIDLTNTGGTVTFRGGLAVTTTSGIAFNASGSGATINVCATNDCAAGAAVVNTLTSTTGTALNVANTTIGASNLTFRSISSTGIGTNGIVLNGTGAGGFTVTGTGTTAGSGGTIQSKTKDGITIISANNITLTNMNLTGNGTAQNVAGSASTCGGNLLTGNNLGCVANLFLQAVTGITLTNVGVTNSGQVGINGNNVTTFAMSNSAVTGNGNEDAENGLTFQNLKGTCSITDTLIRDNFDGQVAVANIENSSTLTLGITGTRTNNAYPTQDTSTTMIGRTVVPAAAEAGILFNTLNTSTNVNMTLNLTGVVFNNNYPANAVFLNMNSASGALGGTTTNCSFDRNGGGVILQMQNGQGGNYNVTNSEFNQSDLQSILYSGLNPFNATVTGTVQGNTIGTPASAVAPIVAPGSACTPGGSNCTGIDVNMIGGSGSIQVKIGGTGGGQANTVQQFDGNGIRVVGNGSGSIQAAIQNNTIQNPFNLVAHGLDTNIGTTAGATIIGCFNITGNTITGTYEDPGVGQLALHTRVRFSAEHRLPGMSGTGAANAEAFLNTNNPSVGGLTRIFSEGNGVPGYQSGAACVTPTIPPPAEEDAANNTRRFDNNLSLLNAPFLSNSEFQVPGFGFETLFGTGGTRGTGGTVGQANSGELRVENGESQNPEITEVGTRGTVGQVNSGELRIENGELAGTDAAQSLSRTAQSHSYMVNSLTYTESSLAYAASSPTYDDKSAAFGDKLTAFATKIADMISPTVYAQDTQTNSAGPNSPNSGETVTVNGSGSGFTLPAGKSITVTFSATVNTPPPARQVSTQGSVSYTGGPGSPVSTTDPGPPIVNGATVTLIDTLMTWNGVTSTDWNTATNWTPPAGGTQYAPGVSNPAVNDVVIPNVGNQPTIGTTDIGVFSLNIANGRTLTIGVGRTLNIGAPPLTPVGGDLTLDGIISGGALNFDTGSHNLTNAGGTGRLSATNVATVLNLSTVTLNNNLQAGSLAINAGGTMDITNRTLSLNGPGVPLNVAGALTLTGSTVVYNSSTGAQTAAALTYNNLTISNSDGVTLGGNTTVNGVLNFTVGKLTTAANTLTIDCNGSVTGASPTTFVIGNLKKNYCAAGVKGFEVGTANGYSPVSVNITAGTFPAGFTVKAVQGPHPNFASPQYALQRYWTLTGSGVTADLTFNYLDPTDIMGIEANYVIFKYNGAFSTPGGTVSPATNQATITGVTSFSDWTLAQPNAPTAANGTVTGRIVASDGTPVEGAVVRLDGTQNRKFITDANGVYRFDNVETNGFYTVTPSRANYSFSPSARSFSLLGETTEAAFGATLTSGALVNPLDTPEYFVRQHYVDFLGREPDEAGFNFWSDQILECGPANIDQNCSERRRVNVSAAYFLSIEFQQTGGLVDGLYRVSYGVRPDFGSFMPDTRLVGLGVVVGRDGWEAKLAANKEAFVEAFVNRPTFVGVYGNMDNSLFVDTLIGHTGVSFTSSERDALVSGLGTGTLTRAEALQSIAENSRFVNAKFNEAFVLMEYFGYLRRDPDAKGYAFWLNKLGEFNGNFEQAEMVKAFTVSGEYRDRFPR